MEHLQNGMTLELCPGAFPLSTDSVALSGFVRLPAQASVLDLGSGCGTLGMLLCARDSTCRVTGVELRREDHETALRNAEVNRLSGRLSSICADISSIPDLFSPGSFRCCVSNPPYFHSGPASRTVPAARREDCCTLDQLLRSAAWALQYGGDFFLVHRPERLAEIFTAASNLMLEPKRLCLLRHRENSPVSLVLIQMRKGGKPGLQWEEWALYDASGRPTEQYHYLYHCQEVHHGRNAVSGPHSHR